MIYTLDMLRPGDRGRALGYQGMEMKNDAFYHAYLRHIFGKKVMVTVSKNENIVVLSTGMTLCVSQKARMKIERNVFDRLRSWWRDFTSVSIPVLPPEDPVENRQVVPIEEYQEAA